MANIPSDTPFGPNPFSQQINLNASISKISLFAQSCLSPSSEETDSTASLEGLTLNTNHTNTTHKTNETADIHFRPKALETLRMQFLTRYEIFEKILPTLDLEKAQTYASQKISQQNLLKVFEQTFYPPILAAEPSEVENLREKLLEKMDLSSKKKAVGLLLNKNGLTYTFFKKYLQEFASIFLDCLYEAYPTDIRKFLDKLSESEMLEVFKEINKRNKDLFFNVYITLTDRSRKKMVVESIHVDLPDFFKRMLDSEDAFSLAMVAKKIDNTHELISLARTLNYKKQQSHFLFYLIGLGTKFPERGYPIYPNSMLEFQELAQIFLETDYGTEIEFLSAIIRKFLEKISTQEFGEIQEKLENAA